MDTVGIVLFLGGLLTGIVLMCVAIVADSLTARKKTRQALRSSEELLHLTMNHSPIGMALLSPEGNWLQANTALLDMLGYSEEELLVTDFQHITHPDDLTTDLIRKQSMIDGNLNHIHTEKRYLRKNGEILWVLLHSSLVRNADGTPRHFIAQIIDITEQKQVDEAKEKLIHHLAETNTALERFAFMASHDLREPARLVCSYAELLQQEYASQLDSMGQKYIGICAKAAQRMSNLISDLLEYARIGKGEAPKEHFTGDSALSYAKDMLDKIIAAKDAEITSGTLPELHTNKTAFCLLLQNLIGNALKYSRPDAPPKIHVEARQDGENWLFSVRDNGLGIKPEFREQIFEPFRRLHHADEYEGTGMGLAICKKIAHQLQGEIWVDSIPGQGSVFFFTLPR